MESGKSQGTKKSYEKTTHTKTDRRVRKTRAQLRAGLARIMQTKSIKEITVKELVDEVDINRSTFYLHYTDIYQMLDSIEENLLQEISEAMDTLPDNPAEGDSYPFITRMFSILEENRDICSALLGSNGDMAFVTRIEIMIADTIISRLKEELPDDIQDITYTYAFCLTGCVGMVKAWLSSENSDSPQHMANLTHQLVKNTAHYYLEKSLEQ